MPSRLKSALILAFAVSLTLAEYEALRGANRPVLASGHEKVAPAGELSTA